MFNDKEANGVAKLEEGSRSDKTYSNSTFDRMVHPAWESSGGGSNAKGENPIYDFTWMGRTSLCGRNTRGQEPGGRERSNRKLDDVDDEEFDIPPLYDDTVYEAAEIPGLDVEEADGVVHVGKVYGELVGVVVKAGGVVNNGLGELVGGVVAAGVGLKSGIGEYRRAEES